MSTEKLVYYTIFNIFMSYFLSYPRCPVCLSVVTKKLLFTFKTTIQVWKWKSKHTKFRCTFQDEEMSCQSQSHMCNLNDTLLSSLGSSTGRVISTHTYTLHKKCPYSELFWSECRKIRTWKYGHFSHSDRELK